MREGDRLMAISIDEINATGGAVFLDIGAGGASKKAGFLSVDVLEREGVDLVGDAADLLSRITDGRVDGIYTRHFLEHVDDVPALIREMVRVCKSGARIEVIVPHFRIRSTIPT